MATTITDRRGRPLVTGPWRGNCRALAATNITLSGLQTVDGVALAVGDRVMAALQTNLANCGVYVVRTGAWTRALDFDSEATIKSLSYVGIEEGTLYKRTTWECKNVPPIVVGTTALTISRVIIVAELSSLVGVAGISFADITINGNYVIDGDTSPELIRATVTNNFILSYLPTSAGTARRIEMHLTMGGIGGWDIQLAAGVWQTASGAPMVYSPVSGEKSIIYIVIFPTGLAYMTMGEFGIMTVP